MGPVAERVARAVAQNFPDAFCFPCLAAQQGLREHDVRAAALILIVRGGLRIVQRVCCSCQRTGEVLVSPKDGQP